MLRLYVSSSLQKKNLFFFETEICFDSDFFSNRPKPDSMFLLKIIFPIIFCTAGNEP